MALVNAIRTGVELLSDVGIMQNIISTPGGDNPAFYDTAWTLQVVRGVGQPRSVLLLRSRLHNILIIPRLHRSCQWHRCSSFLPALNSTMRGVAQKQLLIERFTWFQILSA